MTAGKVIVIGGGFAGCAAAVASVKAGLETVLIERTDLLLAGGNRAGRMNYNGKMVAAEEAKALGGGEVFETLESIVLHRAGLAGEDHGYTYDCCLAEPAITRLLKDFGVQVLMERRVADVVMDGDRLKSVVLDPLWTARALRVGWRFVRSMVKVALCAVVTDAWCLGTGSVLPARQESRNRISTGPTEGPA